MRLDLEGPDPPPPAPYRTKPVRQTSSADAAEAAKAERDGKLAVPERTHGSRLRQRRANAIIPIPSGPDVGRGPLVEGRRRPNDKSQDSIFQTGGAPTYFTKGVPVFYLLPRARSSMAPAQCTFTRRSTIAGLTDFGLQQARFPAKRRLGETSGGRFFFPAPV